MKLAENWNVQMRRIVGANNNNIIPSHCTFEQFLIECRKTKTKPITHQQGYSASLKRSKTKTEVIA